MSTTSKSPRMVALVALKAAQHALPSYAHRFSPKTFTQPQLFACLVLKAFFKTDYRGITAILADLPNLRHAIGLQKVPHFTTLQKAARRLLVSASAQRLLTVTVHSANPSAKVNLAAVDSSGLESHHVSRYFVRRRSREPGLWQTTTQRGRPRKDGKPKPVHGHCRREMKNHFPQATYGQRWQVETVFSMIKRNLGSALKSRTYWAQCREMMLLALVHNIMILLFDRELFYRAG